MCVSSLLVSAKMQVPAQVQEPAFPETPGREAQAGKVPRQEHWGLAVSDL